MPMVESAFNGRQINVPPRLPIILKQFCKAAIRTQPYDLLKWSSAYFRALAEGEEPPTKIRLEYPLPQTISGLTLGFLRVLLRQFGDYNKVLSIEAILRKWDDLSLDRRDLNLIMIIGKFRRKCQVKKFLAIAVGLLGSSLFETMLMICELFTLEPDGGSAMIPVTLFMEIYGYLAGLRCDGGKRESFEEDPSEFLIFEAAGSGPRPPEVSSLAQDSNDTTVSQVSLASQDTEADANLDLESSSKDEPESEIKNASEVPSKNSSPTSDTPDDDEEKLSDRHLDATETSNCDVADEASVSREQTASKSEKEELDEERDCDETSDDVTLTSNPSQALSKTDHRTNVIRARKKLHTDERTLMSYYPNVLGIGPRLMPEEIAAVAVWMTECAKLQEGMVGPRNLRHPRCPNLDRPKSSDSRT